MLLWIPLQGLKAGVEAAAPEAVETRSSNPMLVHVGRMLVRCLPLLIILVP